MEGHLAPLRVNQDDNKGKRVESPAAQLKPSHAVVNAPGWKSGRFRAIESPYNYLIVVAAVLAATLLRMGLQPLLGEDHGFATFTLAVIVVSCLCGMSFGVMAIVLGCGAGIALTVLASGPASLFAPSFFIGIGVFLATSITVAVICGAVKSSKQQAEKAATLATERQRRLERETEARELAQDAAREASDQVRRLLDRIAEAVVSLDLDWNIVYANDNAVNLLGRDGEASVGRKLYDVLSIDLQGDLMRRLNDACHVGLPARFELADPKTKRWIEYRAYPTAEGITLFARDVTEEKRTRIALEESDLRYRTFLSQSSESIWRFELEKPVPTDLPLPEQIDAFYQYGYLAECNDTMARQHGYRSADEIIGKRLDDLLPRQDVRNTEYLKKFIGSKFRLEGVESMEVDKSGRRHYYLNNLLGIQKDGMLVRAWGTQRDVTKQKLAEAEVRKLNAELEKRVEDRTLELRSANRELEAFCYSVSHDLRAPLRSIISQSNILLEDHSERLDDEGIEALTRLIKSAKSMANTLETLLELSKLQRSEMAKTEVDISELAEFISHEIKARGSFPPTEFRIAPQLCAIADKSLLRVALVNLMENACKFAGRGEHPIVEVGSCSTPQGKAFFVRDNGVGFDMKYVDKIFRPFERLHRADDYPGTGIGLANVQRVIERHGGRVWAEGAVGHGATFYFTL